MNRLLFTGILLVCVVLSFVIIQPGSGQVQKGQQAPVFNLRNVNGELVRPFQEGMPVVLSFFFTECQKCRDEIRQLSMLAEKYNGKVGVYLVGTSFKSNVDVSDDVAQYISNIGVGFLPMVDKYKDVIRKYGVTSYPSLYYVNKKGIVAYSCSAFNEKTINDLEKHIQKGK